MKCTQRKGFEVGRYERRGRLIVYGVRAGGSPHAIKKRQQGHGMARVLDRPARYRVECAPPRLAALARGRGAFHGRGAVLGCRSPHPCVGPQEAPGPRGVKARGHGGVGPQGTTLRYSLRCGDPAP